ncbi:MAG: diguanylate cyclase [Xanthobacter sp.]
MSHTVALQRVITLPLDAACRIARELLHLPAALIHLPHKKKFWMDAEEDLLPQLKNTLKSENTPENITEKLDANGLHTVACLSLGQDHEATFLLLDQKASPLPPAQMSQFKDVAHLAALSLNLWQVAMEAQMAEAEFRLLAETSTDTIVRGNLDGVRLYISPACHALLGYAPEELIGKRALDIVHPDDAPAMRDLLTKLAAGEIETSVIEMRQRHANGSWVWMEASIRLARDPTTGAAIGYVASARDIGRRKMAEARLEELSLHDVLTNLPNRALMASRLDEAIEACRTQHQRFALFYMDLDHFKPINDTLGHQTGDAVLCEVAQRFLAALRPNDIVARLGGDEFALILRINRGDDEAALVARRLLRTIAQPFSINGSHITILRLSIGIAMAPECGLEQETLLQAADKALYKAKHGGRNTFRFATPPLPQPLLA